MTKETTYKIIEEIEKKLNEYNVWADVYEEHFGICIEINWGDWKHEHLCAEWITRELLDLMGYAHKYTITEDITEEDGSDCYSARHLIRFAE